MSHPKPNFNRMLELIDEVFETRQDPEQIQVNPGQLKKLEKIHSATLTEFADENGPGIWILMIPTTIKIMQEFIEGKISEKVLLEQTQPGQNYEAIYLCSATTLPEYRGKGLTKKLCLEGIESIKKDHKITTLFVWPFTKEGELLSESIAKVCGLSLFKKTL